MRDPVLAERDLMLNYVVNTWRKKTFLQKLWIGVRHPLLAVHIMAWADAYKKAREEVMKEMDLQRNKEKREMDA